MNILLPVGMALFISCLISRFSHRLRLPAVLGYILIGLMLGPSGLNLLDQHAVATLDIINDAALGMIAFIIGREIHLRTLRRKGATILTVTLFQQIGSILVVALGVYWVTSSWVLAVLLGALSSASAPAGTAAVLQENKAKGPLTETLYTIVGVDDGLAVMAYVFAVMLAHFHSGRAGGGAAVGMEFLRALGEIIGAIILGGGFGVILGKTIKRTRDSADILELILGAVVLCTGLSLFLGFSLILSTLTLGIVVANFFSRANRKAGEPIHLISLPVYVLFFIIAGAHMQLEILPAVGWLGCVYVVCRIIGKMGGAYLGGAVSGSKAVIRKYTGFGILSQAGVAVGLAVAVSNRFSGYIVNDYAVDQVVLNVIIATTIVFELLGPLGVQFAVSRAGETRA